MPTDQAAVCLDVGSTWTKAVLVRPDGWLATGNDDLAKSALAIRV